MALHRELRADRVGDARDARPLRLPARVGRLALGVLQVLAVAVEPGGMAFESVGKWGDYDYDRFNTVC